MNTKRLVCMVSAFAALTMFQGCRGAEDPGRGAVPTAATSRAARTHDGASTCEQIYQNTVKTNVHKYGPKLKHCYPTLVSHLPEDWFKVASIAGDHGWGYVATELAPFLNKTRGDRRLAVAALTTMFSRGYCPQAKAVLEQARPEGSVTINCIRASRVELQRADDLRANREAREAIVFQVPLHRWHVMSHAERWQAILRTRRQMDAGTHKPAFGAGTPQAVKAVLSRISIENWWASVRQLGTGWSVAYQAERQLHAATGERRVLLAIVAGIASYGVCPEADQILASPPDGTAPELVHLAADMRSVLADIRGSYSPYEDLGGHYGVTHLPRLPAWRQMSLQQRWDYVFRRLRDRYPDGVWASE